MIVGVASLYEVHEDSIAVHNVFPALPENHDRSFFAGQQERIEQNDEFINITPT